MVLVFALQQQLMQQASPGLTLVLTDAGNGIANILTWHDNNPRYAMIAQAFTVRPTSCRPGSDSTTNSQHRVVVEPGECLNQATLARAEWR
jgi:hypothetical protein